MSIQGGATEYSKASTEEKKYGMNIEFRVGPRGKTDFTSIFDPSGMSEEQIF